MQITDIRIRKIAKEGKMKAVVSVTFDNAFVVHDIKVIEGEKGLFIAMPSRKASDGEYRDIAHPINSDTRDIIQKSILQEYEAIMASGLSVSGLQMQTVFRNPLAGPSVLGISSGASLGVACVVLLSGAMGGVALSRLGYMGEVALSVAAIIGALSVMALIVYVSQKVKGNVTLLIIGVMIGYVASAVIGVLKYFSVEEDIRAYVIWGLGSFARVSGDQMLLRVAIM